MKGDFSRDTFRPLQHYSRVLLQQGRVQLDADWNEQVSILLHHLRTLTADLIGPHAGPAGNHYGFQIVRKGSNLVIGRGRYYVGGILCENEADLLPPHAPPPTNNELAAKLDDGVTYLTQPDWFPKALTNGTYFLYLDVWERFVSAVEDDSLREVALGGPDTAGRARIVWQVKAKALQSNVFPYGTTEWEQFLGDLEKPTRGRLKAVAKKQDTLVDEPCTIHPDARYRGENQLWRVEVHRGGKLVAGEQQPTFKVSFDNGSVVFPVIEAKNSTKDDAVIVNFTVKDLGRDARTTLNEGDWVELVDKRSSLQCGGDPLAEWEPDPLLQVVDVDRESFVVTARTIRIPSVLSHAAAERGSLLLRRWDHRAFDVEPRKDGDAYGTFGIEEGPIDLPDGIQIAFESSIKQTPHTYRSGDYWLIPAREATGDVEWNGEYQLPRGVVHHYAPLAIARVVEGQLQNEITDLRASFSAPSQPYPYEGEGIGIDEL